MAVSMRMCLVANCERIVYPRDLSARGQGRGTELVATHPRTTPEPARDPGKADETRPPRGESIMAGRVRLQRGRLWQGRCSMRDEVVRGERDGNAAAYESLDLRGQKR